MIKNIEELKDWSDGARRGLENEIDRLKEKEAQLNDYLRVLNATDELLEENDDLREELERKQTEIDGLEEQLEQKDKENDDLRRQLLEVKNLHLEAEANAKPMEIHNHFESGSSSQVFNDKVNGRFTRNPNMKTDKKDKKKRWKKIVRKVL